METDEDRKWFEALKSGVAGRNDPVGSEAVKLREAILSSRTERGHGSATDVEHGLQRLRFRIRSEGLTRSGEDLTSRPTGTEASAVFRRRRVNGPVSDLEQVRGDAEQEVPVYLRRSEDSRGSSESAKYRNAGWAAAACLVVSLAVLIPLQQDSVDEEESVVLRGGSSAVTQLVDNPEARAKDLVRILLDAGALPTTSRLNEGRIQIRVLASIPVLDALQAERIEPKIEAGHITFVLAPISKKP